MSKMTKFLKQTCSWEPASRDKNGNVVLNEYGEIQYEAPTIVKCRRERITKDVATSNGSILRSYSRYFIDDSVPINVDDRLDSHVVLEVEEYTNQFGKTEGYEVYVQG